jgi:hypothetical protein
LHPRYINRQATPLIIHLDTSEPYEDCPYILEHLMSEEPCAIKRFVKSVMLKCYRTIVSRMHKLRIFSLMILMKRFGKRKC